MLRILNEFDGWRDEISLPGVANVSELEVSMIRGETFWRGYTILLK